MGMIIERYRTGDRAACLSLFDSNAPRFFQPAEREAFRRFLDAMSGPYLVGRINESVVAGGGYAEVPNELGAWVLCWGMVAASLHGQGLGRALLQARVEAVSKEPAFKEVRLNTSQHSRGFFERFGFATTDVERDGFGPGLHRHAMSFKSPGVSVRS